MEKGIYRKENVSNGVFIFTESRKFIEPKFWGLYEDSEKALCAVIVCDGQGLFFYPEDVDNKEHILLDWDEELVGQQNLTLQEAMEDIDGYRNTENLAAAGSLIAGKVLGLDLCGFRWNIPTLKELKIGYNNKTMLNAILAISGKQPIKDNWYWSSSRRSNKSYFVLNWLNGFRYNLNQNNYCWVRPVSAVSLKSI